MVVHEFALCRIAGVAAEQTRHDVRLENRDPVLLFYRLYLAARVIFRYFAVFILIFATHNVPGIYTSESSVPRFNHIQSGQRTSLFTLIAAQMAQQHTEQHQHRYLHHSTSNISAHTLSLAAVPAPALTRAVLQTVALSITKQAPLAARRHTTTAPGAQPTFAVLQSDISFTSTSYGFNVHNKRALAPQQHHSSSNNNSHGQRVPEPCPPGPRMPSEPAVAWGRGTHKLDDRTTRQARRSRLTSEGGGP